MIVHDTRRAALLDEVAAVADRYEQDTPPTTQQERYDGLTECLAFVWPGAKRPALYELAGRVLAWLEADAEAERKR